jgi:hypothetical protein
MFDDSKNVCERDTTTTMLALYEGTFGGKFRKVLMQKPPAAKTSSEMDKENGPPRKELKIVFI